MASCNCWMYCMGEKKGIVIYNIIMNYLQTITVNEFLARSNLPKNIVMVVSTLNNLDQISIVQLLIAKLGVWKFWAYLCWFVFIA